MQRRAWQSERGGYLHSFFSLPGRSPSSDRVMATQCSSEKGVVPNFLQGQRGSWVQGSMRAGSVVHCLGVQCKSGWVVCLGTGKRSRQANSRTWGINRGRGWRHVGLRSVGCLGTPISSAQVPHPTSQSHIQIPLQLWHLKRFHIMVPPATWKREVSISVPQSGTWRHCMIWPSNMAEHGMLR